MTAYTAVREAWYTQEGEIQHVVLALSRLDSTDTLDLTPFVKGRKIIQVDAVDHGTTVINDVESYLTTTSTATSKFETSLAVSTDIVTFTHGGVAADEGSTDAFVFVTTLNDDR